MQVRISIYPSLQVHSVTPPAGTSHTLLIVQGVGFSGMPHATPRCIFHAARGGQFRQTSKFRQTSATRLSDTQLRCHSPRDVYGLVPPPSWANGTSDRHVNAHDGAPAHNGASAHQFAHDGVAGGGGDGGGGGLLYVRIGITINGVDETRVTGEVAPTLPWRLRPPPPPPPPPLPPESSMAPDEEGNSNETTTTPRMPPPAMPPSPPAPPETDEQQLLRLTAARLDAESSTELNASSADAFAIFPLPALSTVSPAGTFLAGGVPLTIFGRGFDVLREVRAVAGGAVLGGQCRFGGPSGVRVPGTALDDGAFACASPDWGARAPGRVPIEISISAPLGADYADWVGGRRAPILFTLTRPFTLSSVLPAGGPVHGGTRLYLRGDGFEGYARTTPSASLCKFGPFEGHAFEGYPYVLMSADDR